MTTTTLVAYSGFGELLVCAKADEPRLLKEWFKEGGRELDEYDRDEGTGIMELRLEPSPSFEVRICD